MPKVNHTCSMENASPDAVLVVYGRDEKELNEYFESYIKKNASSDNEPLGSAWNRMSVSDCQVPNSTVLSPGGSFRIIVENELFVKVVVKEHGNLKCIYEKKLDKSDSHLKFERVNLTRSPALDTGIPSNERNGSFEVDVKIKSEKERTSEKKLETFPGIPEPDVTAADWIQQNVPRDTSNSNITPPQPNPLSNPLETEAETSPDSDDSASKEVNILVLGETGVGKSTWINAIANYISFESIDDALSSPLINLIPTEFTLSVKNELEMKRVKVKIGESPNEKSSKCSSVTQQPRAYVFEHNGTTYRIIDTPGIGDTRGIKQDKENIQNILKFTAEYKRLHAVCILLLPNKSRLTDTFESCFHEIVKQFHRTAAKNIVFCFTNSSGSGFCVGETHGPLGQLIDDIQNTQNITIPLTASTMFPFDNMAYRYLCARSIDGEVKFSADLQALYGQAFAISRQETLRLLDQVKQMNPHELSNSTTLNYVRQLILNLTGPLSAINKSVCETLEAIKEKEHDIRYHKENASELSTVLRRKVIRSHFVISRNERYCRNCSKLRYLYDDERLPYAEADWTVMQVNPYVVYVTMPVEHGSKFCGTCGERLTKAKKMFISRTSEVEEEDESTRNRLKDQRYLMREADEQLRELSEERQQLCAEQDIMLNASAQFSCFLIKNSISGSADSTEQYLTHHISRFNYKNQTQQADRLAEYLNNYKALKYSLLEDSPEAPPIGPEEVIELANSLKTMKLYGKDMCTALQYVTDITKTSTKSNPESETRFERLPTVNNTKL